MRVRKLDKNGDYQLGHGSADFYQDKAEGVAQNVMTRLELWRGTWFLDLEAGTPWLQQILGKHDAIDIVLRSRILETPGVRSISSFESILDVNTRRLTVSAVLDTKYGTANISEVTL